MGQAVSCTKCCTDWDGGSPAERAPLVTSCVPPGTMAGAPSQIHLHPEPSFDEDLDGPDDGAGLGVDWRRPSSTSQEPSRMGLPAAPVVPRASLEPEVKVFSAAPNFTRERRTSMTAEGDSAAGGARLSAADAHKAEIIDEQHIIRLGARDDSEVHLTAFSGNSTSLIRVTD